MYNPQRCTAGHRYDGSDYSKCPYCLTKQYFREKGNHTNLFYSLSKRDQHELLRRVEGIERRYALF
jgi:hypothetical protein